MNVWHVFLKELRGAARDRRTLLVVLVFPLVLYPAMFGVQGHFQGQALRQRAVRTPQVLAVGLEDAPGLRDGLERDAVVIPFRDEASAEAALQNGLGHVILRVPPGFEAQLGTTDPPRLALRFPATEAEARAAAVRVELLLEGFADRWLGTRLAERGLPPELVTPFALERGTVALEPATSPLLVALLPFLIVVMVTGGAMAVGAELTAGEKERGTIATLLVSQLSRGEIVLGKFLTILLIALLSSLVSMAGLAAGVAVLAGTLSDVAPGAVGLKLDWTAFPWMVAVLVPLAAMLSAVILIVGTFARNEKEANVYASPLYFVIILLGLVTTTDAVPLSGAAFLIPVVNSLTVLQEVLRGQLDLGHLALTLCSSIGMAGLLIGWAAALFKRESILFRV